MKKFSPFLFVLLLMLTSFTTRAEYQRGDVDHNGQVTIGDVTCLIDYMLYGIWDDELLTEADGHEWVFLALPSGTKWATCNVGANNPEDYGDYFAWGETEPKEVYTWGNYKWCNGNDESITKYCTKNDYGTVDNKTELEPEDDAAYVNWGSSWRMPTYEQLRELFDNCTWMWTSLNGVNGCLLTGPNGNTLFLPASGSRSGSSNNLLGVQSIYWSRRLDTGINQYAIMRGGESEHLFYGRDMRSHGNPVRAVCVSPIDNERGDVDFDGKVTIRDVTELVDYLLTGEWSLPPAIETFTVNGVSFKMVSVEGGTFTMGLSEALLGSITLEYLMPAHEVTLSSYSIGETEVTQALWKAVMGSNPSYFSSSDLQKPVESVSWDDCQTFITKLNAMTGRIFRLPTEAEWEYAARGGKLSLGYNYAGSNTIDDVAWYTSNNGGYTHTVASKAPNELGLYDMSGNVYEWVNDWYDLYSSEAQTNPTGPASGEKRVARGGAVWTYPFCCSVYYRGGLTPSFSGNIYGVRIAL